MIPNSGPNHRPALLVAAVPGRHRQTISTIAVLSGWDGKTVHIGVLMARLALGGTLLYAGSLKALNTGGFAEAIANFDLLPLWAGGVLAVILPWVEILTGVMLVCGLWLRMSSLLSMVMFAGFGVAVVSAIARGLNIECGCFDTNDGTRVGVHTLAIEAAGFAAALLVWLSVRQHRSVKTRALRI
jgi:uncharacterized membrane protein YphA (DoxX/SURF4 family)